MIAYTEVGRIGTTMRRTPMSLHAIGVVGVGLLIAGGVFLAKDPKLFNQWYEWIDGPFLWMMGCSMMIAWVLGHSAHILAVDIQPQVTQVAVKRRQCGIIAHPHTISGDMRLGEAIRRMERTRVGTLPVVDAEGHMIGLLTMRDVRFADTQRLVFERMTPRDRLVVHTGLISAANAERVMAERKVKKLPLINPDDKLLGIIFAKDLRATA